jgi:hypothetical protein
MMHNETHRCLKEREEREGEWEFNGGGELVQEILYACIKLLQLNPLILFMCDKSKIK